jgi:DNA-binding transcriptional ArsR family regulator
MRGDLAKMTPMPAAAQSRPLLDVLTLERPEQLKALGHPLRLRVLETLGTGSEEHLTNRELAHRLGVDPGHLHFHVRMLLKAGLIELAEGGQGREKPYRAVARTVRVAPELLSSGFTSDLRAAMLEEVQRGWAEYGAEGTFRAAQITARLQPERALELITELLERARELEEPGVDALTITTVFHPPTSG